MPFQHWLKRLLQKLQLLADEGGPPVVLGVEESRLKLLQPLQSEPQTMLRLVVGADEELKLLLLLLADGLTLPFLEIVSQSEGAEDQEDGGNQDIQSAATPVA